MESSWDRGATWHGKDHGLCTLTRTCSHMAETMLILDVEALMVASRVEAHVFDGQQQPRLRRTSLASNTCAPQASQSSKLQQHSNSQVNSFSAFTILGSTINLTRMDSDCDYNRRRCKHVAYRPFDNTCLSLLAYRIAEGKRDAALELFYFGEKPCRCLTVIVVLFWVSDESRPLLYGGWEFRSS